MSATVASHAAAVFAYLVLTLLLLLSRSSTLLGRLLLVTCGVTTLWAALVVYHDLLPYRFPLAVELAEIARTACWLLFLGGLIVPTATWLAPSWRRRLVAGLLAALVGGLVLIEVLIDPQIGPVSEGAFGQMLQTYRIIGHLSLAVLGLVCVENIFRNASADSLWAQKFLVVGAGLIFVYDFFIYSDALLLNRFDDKLFDSRGIVNALAVPLIAVAASRNRQWSVEIHVSRGAVFHTAAIIGSGAYLVAMALVGYYLRTRGGAWGVLFQTAFLSAAIVFMLLALFSEAVRARIRLFIAKNFFSYSYDYRIEWLRFIETISAGIGNLHDRAISAMADVVDSPSGAIWVRGIDDEAYYPAARRNFGGKLPFVGADTSLIAFLEQNNWIIDLNEYANRPDLYKDLQLPRWLQELSKAWLVLPLRRRQRLEGFLVLGRPRASRRLDWEDFDLLKTMGQQVASYLAEEAALRALVDAQQLQQFNRRFAFVIHDIKNIASQLSLVLSNSERHGDNPEFQRDAMRTVRNAVQKMGGLLGQLKLDEPAVRSGVRPLALAPVIREVARPWLNAAPPVTLKIGDERIEAMADEERLSAVIGHLLQNAVEAVDGDGSIVLSLDLDGDMAVLAVTDDGPGMDADFIRDELFRPLHTTKRTGSGLGAYQTRELVRDMGGRLDVISAPGAGTTVKVMLPQVSHVAEPATARAGQRG